MGSGCEAKDRKRNGLILSLAGLGFSELLERSALTMNGAVRDGFDGPVGSHLESGKQRGKLGWTSDSKPLFISDLQGIGS